MKCNFILVLLFAGILCCAAQTGVSLNGLPPQHDRFKLALVWPNSYCVTDYHGCKNVLPQYFVIKAFWAELHSGQRLENCRTTRPPLTEAMISRHKADMLNYWPDLSKITYQDSVTMWKDQWERFGTCAADILSAEDYITNTVAVRRSHNLFNILGDAGIVPGKTYSSRTILSTLKRALNNYVDIVCGLDQQGNIYLNEIHQCLDSRANTFVDCENNAINCFGDPIFPNKDFSSPTKVLNATKKKQVTEIHA